MKVLLLVDEGSWFRTHVQNLIDKLARTHHKPLVTLSSDHRTFDGAWDVTLLISYSRIVQKDFLSRAKHNLVVHESALPHGKGMSPLTWQILEGKNEIPITLFEAVEGLDAGPIYRQDVLTFEGHELVEELRHAQAMATIKLLSDFFDQPVPPVPRPQQGTESVYPRRRPEDSRLDPNRTLADQFDLLRVCDNDRYPAYIDIRGKRYFVKIEKALT